MATKTPTPRRKSPKKTVKESVSPAKETDKKLPPFILAEKVKPPTKGKAKPEAPQKAKLGQIMKKVGPKKGKGKKKG